MFLIEQSVSRLAVQALICVFALGHSVVLFSQNLDGYQLIEEIHPDDIVLENAGKGGFLSSDFYVSHDDKLLMITYGYKPTVLTIYDLKSFQKIKTVVVSPWLYRIYTDEDNVYTTGDNAFRRDVDFRINLMEGGETSIKGNDIPEDAREAREYDGEAYLRNSDLLLTSKDYEVFRIYKRTD